MSLMKDKAKFFRGLGDPARLQVLEKLRGGPRTVSELLTATTLLQPNLSMHLACLRECGLVHAHRAGRFVYYELADENVVKLLTFAGEVLGRIASQIEACPRYHLHPKRKRKETKNTR